MYEHVLFYDIQTAVNILLGLALIATNIWEIVYINGDSYMRWMYLIQMTLGGLVFIVYSIVLFSQPGDVITLRVALTSPLSNVMLAVIFARGLVHIKKKRLSK